MFEGYVQNSQLRSINISSKPTGTTKQNNFYNAAVYNRNWQYNQTLPMTWAWYIIQLLFVKGDRNTQVVYGNGIISANLSACNKDWSPTNAWNNGTTTNNTTGVTALGLCNTWGNAFEFLGECRNDNGTIKFSVLGGRDHSNIESGISSTWKSVSTTVSSGVLGEIVGSECQEYPFLGKSVISGNNYSIHYADIWQGFNYPARCVIVGGDCTYGISAGALCAYLIPESTYTGDRFNSRLHVLII